MKNTTGLQRVKRLVFVQIALTLLLALIALLLSGYVAAYSVLLGGMVYIVPSIFFAAQVFAFWGAKESKQIVNGFYKGEAIKIALSVGLFAAVFFFCPITPVAFFIAYSLVQLSHWFAPLFIVNK